MFMNSLCLPIGQPSLKGILVTLLSNQSVGVLAHAFYSKPDWLCITFNFANFMKVFTFMRFFILPGT